MNSDEHSPPEPDETASDAADTSEPDWGETAEDRVVRRLETRLARAESQIQTLQEGISDFHTYIRMAKQRALYLRIGILVALLAAFFFMQYQR